MKVSVIMTVKNGATYLKQAVDSVLKQSHSDFEFCVVDDGSTDDTLCLLEEFAKKDSRVRYLVTGGVGRSAALNMAIENTSAPLICNLDADDLWHHDKLYIQVSIFDQGYEGLLCTGARLINGSDFEVLNYRVEAGRLSDVSKKLFATNPVNHSSVMFERRIVDMVGGYNESRTSLVDYELWGRMMKAGVSMYITDTPLVGKRIHEKQSFENKKRFRYLCGDFMLRADLISSLNAGLKFHVINCFKFFYGLLPQMVRAKFKVLLTER